jgi:alpha-beta hydrolase superfamily lysophospholipase
VRRLGTAVVVTSVTAILYAGGQRPAFPAAAPAGSELPAGLKRFTVMSDGHPMAVWARRPADPRGTILLVHGMTWSTRPDFDLQVPGLHRSVMASLAEAGFAAYGVDLRGYGATPRDATGWLTPRRAAADVTNVLAWVAAQHPALPRPALVGWSRGAAISEMVAEASPGRLSALVLFGFVFDPAAQFIDVPVTGKPPMLKNTADAAAADFVSPDVTPPAVVKAYVEQALRADPIRIDLKGDGEFNVLRPSKLTVPTLVMYGERDAISGEEAGRFFAAVKSADKAMVVLPGADHAALVEDTHDRWIAAVVAFLTRPPVGRGAAGPQAPGL